MPSETVKGRTIVEWNSSRFWEDMARVIWEFQGLETFGTGVIRVIRVIRVGQDSLRFLV